MKLLSPAKINLFLQVTGKRPDGFHNLFTLMCCIGLYDSIQLEFETRHISVSCQHPQVPEDKTNIAHKAADFFLSRLEKNTGVGIAIDKKIPVGAGLGGGSSNAAAVLMGMNRYYGAPFSQEELISMGESIGSDVPFFIFGRPALATGKGEILKPFEGIKPYKILVIYPDVSISTAEVYSKVNLGLTKCKKNLRESLFKVGHFDIREHLCNDLETVATSICPEINKAKQSLLEAGAAGSLMSGSGSAVFGIFFDPDKAESAYRSFGQSRFDGQIFLVEMII